MEFGKLQTRSGKSKKFKFDGLLLSKKYIPSAKALHTEDLSNITFNYLSEKSPNSVCHFLNHKSFFTTQLLCICLAQTLHTCYKSSPSKSKFSDSPLLLLKFTEFLMSSFQTNSQFFFKVWITLQCADRSFFCTFLAETLYWQKQHIKMQISRLATARIKIQQTLHVIFGTKSYFSFELSITLQCYEK